MSPVALGEVIIRSESPSLTVQCMLGEASPDVTDGYGGWEVVARPKRKGITEWRGVNPYGMDLPILLEGWPDTSIEKSCTDLERMARSPGGDDEPPTVQIELPGSVPRSSLSEWVIENIDWGDELRRDDGARVRQFATLTLLEFVEDDHIKISLARKRKHMKKRKKGSQHRGSKQKTYRVRAGDTLLSISAKFLGSSKRWKEIAQLNHIHDPRNLTVGSEIKLP